MDITVTNLTKKAILVSEDIGAIAAYGSKTLTNLSYAKIVAMRSNLVALESSGVISFNVSTDETSDIDVMTAADTKAAIDGGTKAPIDGGTKAPIDGGGDSGVVSTYGPFVGNAEAEESGVLVGAPFAALHSGYLTALSVHSDDPLVGGACEVEIYVNGSSIDAVVGISAGNSSDAQTWFVGDLDPIPFGATVSVEWQGGVGLVGTPSLSVMLEITEILS